MKDAIRDQLKDDLSKSEASDFIGKALKEEGAEVYADKIAPQTTSKKDKKEDTKK